MAREKKHLRQKIERLRDGRSEQDESVRLEEFVLPLLAELQATTELEKFSLLTPESAQHASQMLSRKLEIIKEKQRQVALLSRELSLKQR